MGISLADNFMVFDIIYQNSSFQFGKLDTCYDLQNL